MNANNIRNTVHDEHVFYWSRQSVESGSETLGFYFDNAGQPQEVHRMSLYGSYILRDYQDAFGDPLGEKPRAIVLGMLAAVEASHFRTDADTGANECARTVWNALRSQLGLPALTLNDLPSWDGEQYAMPANSNLLANAKAKEEASA